MLHLSLVVAKLAVSEVYVIQIWIAMDVDKMDLLSTKRSLNSFTPTTFR